MVKIGRSQAEKEVYEGKIQKRSFSSSLGNKKEM